MASRNSSSISNIFPRSCNNAECDKHTSSRVSVLHLFLLAYGQRRRLSNKNFIYENRALRTFGQCDDGDDDESTLRDFTANRCHHIYPLQELTKCPVNGLGDCFVRGRGFCLSDSISSYLMWHLTDFLGSCKKKQPFHQIWPNNDKQSWKIILSNLISDYPTRLALMMIPMISKRCSFNTSLLCDIRRSATEKNRTSLTQSDDLTII